MKRARLQQISEAGFHVMAANDDTIEAVSHEVAHAILLYGRVRVYAQDVTEHRCDGMSKTRANEHEVKTCALQLAGLKALGYRMSGRELRENFTGLILPSKKYETPEAFVHAVRAQKPSERNVRRFVKAYRLFERLA